MAEEGAGQYVQMEQQSNAGKWVLIVLAILVVAGFGMRSTPRMCKFRRCRRT